MRPGGDDRRGATVEDRRELMTDPAPANPNTDHALPGGKAGGLVAAVVVALAVAVGVFVLATGAHGSGVRTPATAVRSFLNSVVEHHAAAACRYLTPHAK